MKVVCQYCGKDYQFDPAKIPAGAKSFKCKGCGHAVVINKTENKPNAQIAPPPTPKKPLTPPTPLPAAQKFLRDSAVSDAPSFEYLYRGAFTLLKYNLKMGETIKAESDAMVAMSSNIRIKGKLEGSFFAIIKRMLAREKIFFQSLTAENGPGEVYLAHAIPGDIMDIPMDGNTTYILQQDGFFAGSEDLEISTKMQGLKKGLFSGKGFFLVKVSGTGTLFVSSYGAIHPIDLADGEEIIVDNYHMVAWPEDMQWDIEKASSGWISSIMSGETLVCRLKGPGKVLIQTRNPKGFGSWLSQFITRKFRLRDLI